MLLNLEIAFKEFMIKHFKKFIPFSTLIMWILQLETHMVRKAGDPSYPGPELRFSQKQAPLPRKKTVKETIKTLESIEKGIN